MMSPSCDNQVREIGRDWGLTITLDVYQDVCCISRKQYNGKSAGCFFSSAGSISESISFEKLEGNTI